MENNFLTLVKSRRMTYEFSDKKVEDSKIEKVLNAAKWAPSWGNTQGWKFIVIKNQKIIEQILDLTQTINYGFLNPYPPVIIVFVMSGKKPKMLEKKKNYTKLYNTDHPMCVAMSANTALLAATSIGLSTAILTPGNKTSKILNIKKGDLPILLIGLGYEKKGAYQLERTRKPLKELVSYKK